MTESIKNKSWSSCHTRLDVPWDVHLEMAGKPSVLVDAGSWESRRILQHMGLFGTSEGYIRRVCTVCAVCLSRSVPCHGRRNNPSEYRCNVSSRHLSFRCRRQLTIRCQHSTGPFASILTIRPSAPAHLCCVCSVPELPF